VDAVAADRAIILSVRICCPIVRMLFDQPVEHEAGGEVDEHEAEDERHQHEHPPLGGVPICGARRCCSTMVAVIRIGVM